MMNMIKSTLLFFLILLIAGCAVQTRPVLTPFADGEYWVVSQPLAYPIPDSDAVIVVPEGFVTDFASIPRVFWSVFPRHGQYTVAAIVHDYLYWDQKCTREQADNLFELVMRTAEVSMFSRLAIYAAVRFGGSSAWDENTELKADGEVRVVPSRFMDFDAKTKWSDYRGKLKASVEPREKDNLVPLYCTALEMIGAEKAAEKEKEAEKAKELEREKEQKEPETVIPETSPIIEASSPVEDDDSDTVETIFDE